MLVIDSIEKIRRELKSVRQSTTIACVPTMGALHEGHLSLIRAATQRAGFVVVTVFVNPLQFGVPEDLSTYPRSLERDLELCRSNGVDCVFQPAQDVIYPESFGTYVEVEPLSSILEGEFRPGHFRGVATVVLKLLNIVQPDAAFFGQKDFQQLLLIRAMCRDLNLPVAIEMCPIVRDPDGLALSSRNQLLSPDMRQSAVALSKSLKMAEERLAAHCTDLDEIREEMLALLNATPSVTVDYATFADVDNLQTLTRPLPQMVALVAANVGRVRLIDNRVISTDAG